MELPREGMRNGSTVAATEKDISQILDLLLHDRRGHRAQLDESLWD
jgi:hypothetical protein